MRQRGKSGPILICALLTMVNTLTVFAQSTGGPFTITSHVVAGGGCGPDGSGGCAPSIGSGNLSLEGTVAEPFAGGLSSETPFSLRSGFWYTLESNGVIATTPLIISEFRLFGTAGANDEFIEIYNNSNASHFVAAPDGSSGYAIAASDGVVRCTIPNGTMSPARGHFLCVNSGGYSLSSYPAGDGTTASGDATYSNDIADNAGIALFKTTIPANFSAATRSDAVGSTSEANSLYKEGAGYPALTAGTTEHSFFRKMCEWIQGQGCTVPGIPKDTNDNAADFWLADTAGTTQRLGAPGPENLSSPIRRDNAGINMIVLDGKAPSSAGANRDRNGTAVPNGTFGTLTLRYRVTNNTGNPLTRLRYRIVDISTAVQGPGATADLRALTSSVEVNVGPVNDPATCTAAGAGAPPCNVTVTPTTLETPPAQGAGGGYNSTLSSGTITTGTPLPAGQSILVNFKLGIQKTGLFRFYIIIEALP